MGTIRTILGRKGSGAAVAFPEKMTTLGLKGGTESRGSGGGGGNGARGRDMGGGGPGKGANPGEMVHSGGCWKNVHKLVKGCKLKVTVGSKRTCW